MTLQNIFSSGLELTISLVNSDPLQQAWNAIENHPEQTSLYNETKLPESNCTIISFKAPASMCSQIQGKQSLVNSLTDSTLKKYDFLCNKNNRSFSVNEAAVSLFSQQFDQLDLLKTQLVQISKTKATKPTEPTPSIIITGHSLGGCAAMLFAFWLLNSLDSSKSKRLLCITFGSPLLGDEQLQQCVSKFSTWNYCFLHVVSNKDPTLKLFQPPGLSGVYKPFGTFLLCSDSGCACFEDPNFILGQLVASDPRSPQNQSPDYGQILEDFKLRTLCNNSFNVEGETDPLQASIKTQMLVIGVVLPQQELSMEIRNLIVQMKSNHKRKVITQKKKQSDSNKKLNEMKIYMAYLEWYKKNSKLERIGYYNRFRNLGNLTDVWVIEYVNKLSNYWEDCVDEVENMPQEEGASLRSAWLMAGTSYRRMVEPLHIARYYGQIGGVNYIKNCRHRHFVLLEQWWMEAERASPSNAKAKRQSAESRLNEDSCFWADVEEALISCKVMMKDKESSIEERESAEKKLIEFERYVLHAIKNSTVSPDVFLEKSSFSRWLKEYGAIISYENANIFNKNIAEAMAYGNYIF